MSNDDFRRDLNRTFDGLAGMPSSNLPDRVRSALREVPAARPPYWIAAVAACVIAALIVSVLFVANPLKRPSSGGVVHPTATPTTTPATTPATTPSTTPSTNPSPSAQPFECVTPGGAPPSANPIAYVSAVRTGTHAGYDRLTIEFANGAPAQVSVESHGTTFELSPSGMSTTVKGTDGVLIVMHGADLHTSYSGPTDIVTGYSGLLEVKRIEDFEGTVQIGLGVNSKGCVRKTWLTNPTRLVIDVQNGG